jgi:hypothetical protein
MDEERGSAISRFVDLWTFEANEVFPLATTASATNIESFDFDLPEYDPELSQKLGVDDPAEVAPPLIRARERAALIAALLDAATRQEQGVALTWLVDLFMRYRSGATFQAIETAAFEGLDFPTLKAMAELREIWADRPDWWVCRFRQRSSDSWNSGAYQMPNGATALSWTLARRICLARSDLPPEDMIDEDWLGEWFALPHGAPGFVSFTAYLHDKISREAARLLAEGLQSMARYEDSEERSDGWVRGLCLQDPADGALFSFGPINPP